MPYCAIITCKNKSREHNLHNGGVSYHRFPHDPDVKEKWIKATGRKNWFPSKFSTVCSKHFQHHEWNIKNSLRYLHPGSIPSIDVWVQQLSKPTPRQSDADEEVYSQDSVADESPASGGEGGSGRGGEGACAACGGDVGTHGRRARGSPAEQFIKAAIFPRELNEKTLLCNECYERYCYKRKGKKNPHKLSHAKGASQRVALSEKSANASTPPTTDLSAAPQQTITLPCFKRALCRSEGCLFPSCQMKTLNIISQYERQCLLRDYKLYAPEHSQICQEHLFSKSWEPLLNIAKSDFTAQHIEDIISILTTNVTAYNFDNIEDVPPNLLLYCTGINHIQFQSILDKLPSLKKKTKTPVLALTAYLTKLKTNDSFDRLSILFQNKKSMLETFTTVAKNCMLQEFVPVHSKIQPSSDNSKRAGEVKEDDLVLRYLQEHYYGDVATTEGRTAMHTRLETVAITRPSLCRKRKNSSDSDDDLLASKVKAKKRPVNEEDKTNQLMEKESEQYAVSEVAVEVDSSERVDAGDASESSEDEGASVQPRVKEEPVDEGEAVGEGEMGDQHLVYAPKPIDDLLADPLDTDAVPAPIVEQVKNEEEPVTIKVEPGEEDSRAPPTTSTLQGARDSCFTVYYTKGASNFIQDPGPKR